MAKIRTALFIVILEYALVSRFTNAQNETERENVTKKAIPDKLATPNPVNDLDSRMGIEGSGAVDDDDDLSGMINDLDLTTSATQNDGTHPKRPGNMCNTNPTGYIAGGNSSRNDDLANLKSVLVIAGIVSGVCFVILILNCSQLCVLVRVLPNREQEASVTNNAVVPIPKIIVDKGSDDHSDHTLIDLDDEAPKSDTGDGNENPVNPVSTDQTSPVNDGLIDKGEETDKATDIPPTQEPSLPTDACSHADGISPNVGDGKTENQTAKATQEPSSTADAAVKENVDCDLNQISESVKASSEGQAPLPNDQKQVSPAEAITNDNDFDTHKHLISENELQHEVNEEMKARALDVSENTANESVSIAKSLAENDSLGVGEGEFDFPLPLMSEVGMNVGTSDQTDEFPEISHL